jgi:hypothetical protein
LERMAPATRRKVIGGGGGKGGKGGKRKGDVGLPDELEEDVDRYVDGRNRLMMGGGEDASEEEEEERELVMGVGGGAPDSDDEEFVDSSDDEDGVKTGKHLEGIMSDDEDEKTKLEEQGWGKDKSDYYDRDEMSDTEDEEEEEKEAKRIRAKQSEGLKSTDFGEDDVVASDEEEEEEDDTLATKRWVPPPLILLDFTPTGLPAHSHCTALINATRSSMPPCSCAVQV